MRPSRRRRGEEEEDGDGEGRPGGAAGAVTKVIFAVGAVAAATAFAFSKLTKSSSASPSPAASPPAASRWSRYRPVDAEDLPPRSTSRSSSGSSSSAASSAAREEAKAPPPPPPPSQLLEAARQAGRLPPLGELMGRVFPEREPYRKRTAPRRGFCPELYRAGRFGLAPETSGPLFGRLPSEAAYRVFEHLQLHEVCAARGVCAAWREFLRPLVSDYDHLKRCARQGFADTARAQCWALAAGTPRVDARKREMYRHMVEQPSRSDAEIGRDGNRTLIHHGFFPSDRHAEEALVRMLGAYATHDPGVGYTQGMNFCAGFLLTVMGEEEAYWMLYSVMVSPRLNVRGMFAPGLPELQVAQYQLQRCLDWFLPDVAEHFRRNHIDVSLYATEWFMTLYTYNRALPLATAVRIWDLFLVRGWKVMHRVALAILDLSRATLLELEFEETIQYLKLLPDQGILLPDLLLERALGFKVTGQLLHRLAEEYHREVGLSGAPPPQ